MHCHECGTTVPEGAGTCPECGATVTGADTDSGATEPSSTTETERDPASESARSTRSESEPDRHGGDLEGRAEASGDPERPPSQQGGQPSTGQPSQGGQPQGTQLQQGSGQPSQGHPRQGQPAQGQPAQGQPSQGQGQPPRGQGQPPQGQPPQGQPPQGQPPQGQPPQGQPPQGQPPQGQGHPPQGQPPQGQGQQASPGGRGQRGRPPQGNPRGSGRGPGGPAPAGGGHGGGYGQQGGFDLDYLLETLPLLPGAVAGAAVGVFLFAFSVVFAVVADFFASDTLSAGALILHDLHFATTAHVTPALFQNFEIVQTPAATLGFLYLLAPLLLYKVAKIVVGLGLDDDAPMQDAALSGATLVLGYLPIMLAAAVLVPSNASEGWHFALNGILAQFSVGTAVLFAGIIYPLLFGALGGLSAGKFSAGERRIGVLYGVVGFVAVFVGLFATSFIYINTESTTGGFIEFGMFERLIATIVTLAQTHTLSLGGFAESSFVAYGTVFLIVGLVGFLRAYRSSSVQSPVDAVAVALTPAVTYITLFAFIVSSAVVFADGYIQEELELGFLFANIVQALVTQSAGSIGDYVNLVFVSLLLFPVIVGGLGGLAAWYLENRNRQPAPPTNPRY